MAASENFWMAQSFYFVLCVFSYIIASSAGASLAFFLEPELGHDGAEAAVVGAFLQVAVGDDLGGNFAQGEEDGAGFFGLCRREVDGDDVLLALWHHKGLDVLFERLDVG